MRWVTAGVCWIVYGGLLVAAENPFKDPPDQLFRRAPMAASSRSLAIPLGRGLHAAYDLENLHLHTVWRGAGLALYGPPFHGAKKPFVCQPEGEILWTLPPLPAWRQSTGAGAARPVASRFTAIATSAGRVQIEYQLAADDTEHGTVEETPWSFQSGSSTALVRTARISGGLAHLEWLVQLEAGVIREFGQRGAAFDDPAGTRGWACAIDAPPQVALQIGDVDVDYVADEIHDGDGAARQSVKRVTGRRHLVRVLLGPTPEPVLVHLVALPLAGKTADQATATELQRLVLMVEGEYAKRPVREAGAGALARDRQAGAEPRRPDFGDASYRVEDFPIPPEVDLKVTGMDWFANGDLAVCTWAGEVFRVAGVQGDPAGVRFSRLARGLNEAFGLKVVGDDVWVVQKCELTRLRDTDQNGTADRFESLCAAWKFTGDYHDFTFGPLISDDGDIYLFRDGQRGAWDVPFMSWCVRVAGGGTRLEGHSSGLRVANGWSWYGARRDLFVTDNQGNWVGACKLNHLREGAFYGYPASQPAPQADYGLRTDFEPPAVWFPRKLAPSASGIEEIRTERFGPFQGQMLVGDFQNSIVMRVFLEEVGGRWQGAAFPFARGFGSGVNRLLMAPDGRLYVGGLKNKAWPAFGPREHSLERVSYSGQVPFEIRCVRALPGGFELEWTREPDRQEAIDPGNYLVTQFNYRYHAEYGSPEYDHAGNANSATEIEVKKAELSPDARTVRLELPGLKPGFVAMIQSSVGSAQRESLRHDTCYYTLNQLPAADPSIQGRAR